MTGRVRLGRIMVGERGRERAEMGLAHPPPAQPQSGPFGGVCGRVRWGAGWPVGQP